MTGTVFASHPPDRLTESLSRQTVLYLKQIFVPESMWRHLVGGMRQQQFARWLADSLPELPFGTLRQPIAPEANWQPLVGDTRQASFARWTNLGAAALSTWARAHVPRLIVKGTARGTLASLISIPIHIEHADRLHPKTIVLVSNVPEDTALSVGSPLGAGAWIVPADLLERLAIVSYALPSQRQLTLDLLDSDGNVLSSARVLVEVA